MTNELNVLGTPLQPCGTDPMTGFFRDGCCSTGPEDLGSHTVCAVVTEEFLRHQVSVGNDLTTPRPEYRFPGLVLDRLNRAESIDYPPRVLRQLFLPGERTTLSREQRTQPRRFAARFLRRQQLRHRSTVYVRVIANIHHQAVKSVRAKSCQEWIEGGEARLLRPRTK